MIKEYYLEENRVVSENTNMSWCPTCGLTTGNSRTAIIRRAETFCEVDGVWLMSLCKRCWALWYSGYRWGKNGGKL